MSYKKLEGVKELHSFIVFKLILSMQIVRVLIRSNQQKKEEFYDYYHFGAIKIILIMFAHALKD